jgi:hypothetical protein
MKVFVYTSSITVSYVILAIVQHGRENASR